MLLLEITLVLNAGFAVWLMAAFKLAEVTQ
jgi:hypothetical protein